MQSTRSISKLSSRIPKQVLVRTPKRNMAFFPRGFVAEDPAASFTPLFRLLNDFDQFSRGMDRNSTHSLKSFTPKFDVREVNDAYELHGELPGIDQKDVEIEFTDAQTLVVKGSTEHQYTSGTPPSNRVEDAPTKAAITEKAEDHKATVEDAGEDGEPTSTEVQTKSSTDAEPQKTETKPEAKFWVSERSIGQFSRSFSFPVRVDQDAVTASMKNGILSIVIPKAKKYESRKITIS